MWEENGCHPTTCSAEHLLPPSFQTTIWSREKSPQEILSSRPTKSDCHGLPPNRIPLQLGPNFLWSLLYHKLVLQKELLLPCTILRLWNNFPNAR